MGYGDVGNRADLQACLGGTSLGIRGNLECRWAREHAEEAAGSRLNSLAMFAEPERVCCTSVPVGLKYDWHACPM